MWLVQPALVSFPDPRMIHCWSGNETKPARGQPLSYANWTTTSPYNPLMYCTGGRYVPCPSSMPGSFRKVWNWTSGMRPVAMVKLMHYQYHISLSFRCRLVPRPPPSSLTLAVCRRSRFRVDMIRITLCWRKAGLIDYMYCMLQVIRLCDLWFTRNQLSWGGGFMGFKRHESTTRWPLLVSLWQPIYQQSLCRFWAVVYRISLWGREYFLGWQYYQMVA